MLPELSGIIRAGDGVILGQACAEPQTLAEALVAQRAAFSGASLFLGVNYAGVVRPEHADHLQLSSYSPRSEAGVVVTELGAADLRGCTLNERARRMLRIARLDK